MTLDPISYPEFWQSLLYNLSGLKRSEEVSAQFLAENVKTRLSRGGRCICRDRELSLR